MNVPKIASLTPIDRRELLEVSAGSLVLAAAKTADAEDHLGTLEAGKLADLILLNASPLEDIKNTRKIWRVFKGGWMFDSKVLRPNQN